MDKSKFPKEMLALKNWIDWRLEPDPNGGDPKKVPYSPHNGKKAYVNKPWTWATFDEALAAKEKYGYTGIGFVFTKDVGIVAIDIDDCFTNGELNEFGKMILAKAPKTYIEFSPSEEGLHMLVHGKLSGSGKNNQELHLEIYDNVRYFTMTGNHWHDCTDIIAEDNGIVDFVYKLASSRQKNNNATPVMIAEKITATVLTDEELLKRANASQDGEDFGKLYRGEWQGAFKSQSEADFALCRKLAFWSGKNETQMNRIFRASGLMRDKWNTPHFAGGITYGAKTITNACAATKSIYKPPRNKKPQAYPDNDNPEVSEETPEETSEILQLKGCYYRNKGDKIYAITNFIIEPIEMLTYDDGAQVTANFVTNQGEKFKMHLESATMSDVRTFKVAIGKKTFALTFYGGGGDLDHFRTFIYTKLEWVKKHGAKAMGIYPGNNGEHLVFVDTNGAFGVGGVPDNSIVQLESYKVIESNIMSAPMIDKEGLLSLGKHIMSYNEPTRTVPILAWVAGCFIKPLLKILAINYPHLFLVGERGGGKTNSMEKIIRPIVGQTSIYASSEVTKFTMLRELNSSNIIPLLLEEFKPSKLPPGHLNMLYNSFRTVYDSFKGTRGKPDQSSVPYELLAPIAVAGEESADESAIRERSIELLFSKRDLKNEKHKTSFNWIRANEKLVRSFGRSILDTALQVTKQDVALWYSEGEELFSDDHASRIKSNLCAVYAGICLIGRLCTSLGVSFAEVFPYDNEECAKHLDTSVRQYLLDDNVHNNGIVENTFEIMSRMRLKLGTDYCFENNNQYLTIALSDVYDRFTRYLKDHNVKGETLQYKQFCRQLRNTEYCVKPTFKKRMAKENKYMWTVNFQKLSAVCDVVGFIKETFDDDKG